MCEQLILAVYILVVILHHYNINWKTVDSSGIKLSYVSSGTPNW